MVKLKAMAKFYFLLCSVSAYGYELAPRVIHVANVGNDSILCGNITQPCKTLPHAIKIANWGDAIFLSSPIGETYVTYSCLDDSYGYHINKNLTMRGTPGRAIIDCNGTEMTALFHIKSLKRDHVTLKIDNLEMRNISSPYTVITIEDASLSVRNCIFKDVWSAGTISISGSAKTGSIPHLFIQNSLFASNTNPVMLQDYQAADVEAVNTLFTDEKKFYNCKGIFVNRQSSVPPGFPAPDPPDNLHLRVQNCTFKYNMFGIAVLGLANHTHAEIEGSTFIENKATGLSMILDKGAGLRIDVDTYEKQQVEFLIKNSLFRGNKANVGGGVSIFATPKDYKAADNVLNISFVNVRFEYNMAEQAGGATYIYCLDIQNLITFNNCTFDSNSVISEDPQGRVSHWFVPAETGAGGAVSIDKGNLVIERTSFGNNTATVFGSTICSKANISLKNVGINGSVPRGKSPAIGDLFYSETSAQLINVTFQVVSAVNGIPSVWQKAYDKDDSLCAKNITFICPVGHNVKSVKVKSYTLPKNYYALIYYCLCCPVNTYSLLYGQETLYRRNVSTREVTCFDCPFGAICDPIIKAEPNFYGFANTAEQPSVQLTICPHEYCCSKNCSTINSCRHNREGTLCGRCKKGYSDNLLDTKCTLNSECTDIWIWLVIAALGICYILFFLYVEELVRLIRTIIWPFEFGSSDDCSDEGKSEISEEQQPTVISGEETEETDGKQQPQQQQKQQQSSSFASSLLKVILYFYQMQFVLDVKNGVITEDIKRSLKSVVFDIFSFRVTRRLVSGCPMLGLTPVTKMILKLSFNLYLLIILLILYVTTGLRRRLQKEPSQKLGIFVARLSRCSMTIILLNYTTFADVSLTLLKCVTVQDKKVLFIDGEAVCFAYWQYIVMGCVICFIAPVFLALLIGVPLLNSKIIPAKNFVLALIMPLPFIFLFLKRIKPVQFKESDTNGQDRTLKAASPVLQVLVKPYAREDGSGPIYWEGILLLRRFILVVIVVSIGNAVIRLYVLFAVIIIMLFHHNYVRPFRYPSINMAETISLLILALLCAINAFFARNLNDGQQLKGADILLAKTFEWVVTIIALTIPVALITFVLAAIIIRLVNLSYFGIKKLFCSKKASEIETGSLLNGKGRSYEAVETKSERPSPLQESV